MMIPAGRGTAGRKMCLLLLLIEQQVGRDDSSWSLEQGNIDNHPPPALLNQPLRYTDDEEQEEVRVRR
jgi:hypothetical protein